MRESSGMVIKIKLDIEKIFLVLFFAVFLFIGPGILFEHRISHDVPHAYLSSDSFQHQIRAEGIKDAGNFKYEAFYISKGFKDVVGRYPPVLYHLAVMFSYLSGLEVYDSIYYIVFIFSAFAVLVFYFVMRGFNRNAAILSLPLALLVFSMPPMAGFMLGHWPSLLGQFFLIALFWGFTKFEIEKSYVFIGVIMAALIMSHTANLVFALFFILMFLAARLYYKNFNFALVKKLAYAAVITFVLTAYYLIIFKSTWVISQPYSFTVKPVWDGNPGFYIFDFGIVALFILGGLAFSVISFGNNKNNIAAIASLSMLILGFGNYIGFDFRAFQIRFFWPIYLAFFFGFAVYFMMKLIIKNWNIAYSVVIGAVFIILFAGIVKAPFIPHYEKFSSQGLMDKYHWEAFSWIAKNTPQGAKIYFFYGDIYSQDALLRNSKRAHYQVDPPDFVSALNERQVRESYVTELPGDNGGGLVYRKSFFSFADHENENEQDYFFGKKNACDFDYFVFDRASRQKPLADYNMIIASKMLEKGAEAVFQNELIIVLKNKKVGGDCIEEGNF